MDDDGAWQRYAAWEGTYRVRPWAALAGAVARPPRLPRLRRLAARLLVALLVLVVVLTLVKAVVALVRWDLLELLDVLLNPANAFLLLGAAWLRWPPETRVTSSSLTVRSQPWRTRTVAWSDVEEVQTPGRFDQHPVALLTGGERLELVGLPVEVAEAMAAVTQLAPPDRSSSAARRPAPGDDLDGPFHRGWSGGRP